MSVVIRRMRGADSGRPSRSSPVYYSDWLEPDQPNKERMDCMAVRGNDGRYGWSSERCERRLPFVCENSKYRRQQNMRYEHPESTDLRQGWPKNLPPKY